MAPRALVPDTGDAISGNSVMNLQAIYLGGVVAAFAVFALSLLAASRWGNHRR
jgi:hypothetical protein